MTKADTRLTPHEVEEALKHWRLKPLFTRPGGGTANASLIVVGVRGQFFLRRRNPRYCDPGQLTYDHSVLHGLAKAGLPVPKVVRTPGGSRWLEREGRINELFHLIEGAEADPASLEEVTAAGDLLARFHLVTQRLQPQGKKDWPRYFDPKPSLKGLKEAKKRLLSGDPGDLGKLPSKEVATTLDYLLDQAQLCEKQLPDKAYWALPLTIVHGDWHPANLKFRNHEVVGLFDFDWVGRQPRLVDVTDGLLFFGSVREAPLDGSDIWSLTQPYTLVWERLRTFMSAYRQHVPVCEEEFAALPNLMRQRCLYSRVDAMVRKVEPADQLRFLVTGVEGPLRWIAENEAKLRGDGWA